MKVVPPIPITVLCVDDNADLAEALKDRFARETGFHWGGSLPDTSNLPDFLALHSPAIVLLDVDMPGKNSFETLAQVSGQFPASRIVMFSGHVSRELVAKAVDLGAWGYASKSDGDQALVECVRRVAAGEMGFTPEAHRVYHE